MAELTVPASADALETVNGFIEAQLNALDCPMKLTFAILTAAEEIFVNIAHYSGAASARVEVTEQNREITLRFYDAGRPYDPLAAGDPDVTLSADERKIGGLGVFMVKKMMDSVSYAYEDGHNVLTIRKTI